MRLSRLLASSLLVAIAVATLPSATASDLGYRGWGPRVGLTDSPDQVIGGVHWDLGEWGPHVVFQPDLEFGIGDDVTAIDFTFPATYHWENLGGNVEPYVGGGVVLAVFKFDDDFNNGLGNGEGDDTEFEVGIEAIGGVEWRLKSGNDFFLELSIGFGDIRDAEVVAGWTFRH